jgi:hypothetical protein
MLQILRWVQACKHKLDMLLLDITCRAGPITRAEMRRVAALEAAVLRTLTTWHHGIKLIFAPFAARKAL